MAFNVVELMTEGEEQAFSQPCRFGNLVEGHAVYCHNDDWHDGPGKCRRTWYSGGELKDEDCPGYEPNPEFKGELNPTPLTGMICSACGGSRLRKVKRGLETCSRCMGSGLEPKAVKLDTFAQDTLELGLTHSGKNPAVYERYVRMTETKAQGDAIIALSDAKLVNLHSMSFGNGCTAFLLSLTGKGDATVRANWRAKKS